MQKRRPIRNKLLVVGLLVGFTVTLLSASSFLGVYSYRRLVKALSSRASELPGQVASHHGWGSCNSHSRVMAAVDLGLWAEAIKNEQQIDLLESGEPDFLKWGTASVTESGSKSEEMQPEQHQTVHFFSKFLRQERHCRVIAKSSLQESLMNSLLEIGHERDIARRIALSLKPYGNLLGGCRMQEQVPERESSGFIDEQLVKLTAIGSTWIHSRCYQQTTNFFAIPYARFGTRGTWSLSRSLLPRGLLLAAVFCCWLRSPCVHGYFVHCGFLAWSRRIAGGDFGYRIHLDTRDEMAELGQALNDMTNRFQEIRDDLDHQVQLRTKEVIRSEQLASVGFLAAGVAHEINNPLASIAMCAESLESRIGKDVDAVASRYIQLIQSEAFRCKGITEKLLDFSRVGEVRRQATALGALTHDVVDMLRHVGRFAQKTVTIFEGPDVLVMANPQEIKQVVLNLLVNALDSIDGDGEVELTVRRDGHEAKLVLTDNGCGMDEEVLQNLFEPFFTSRTSKKGTGLGLSIAHRIVTDHDGRIEAKSTGPGCGATFSVILPVATIASQSFGGREESVVAEKNKISSREEKRAHHAA